MLGKIFLNHMINFDLKKSLKLFKRNDYLLVLNHDPNPYFINKNSKKKIL